MPSSPSKKKYDIIGSDFDTKLKLLEGVIEELMNAQEEFVQLSGRYAELSARIRVLKEVRSGLQSALRHEGQL